MTEPLSTTRLDITDNDITIVFTDYQDLARTLHNNILFTRLGNHSDELKAEERDLFKSLYTTIDWSTQTVRIATAKVFDNENAIIPHPDNLLYYETTIQEREPVDAEKQVYEDSFSDVPSPIYEIVIPTLDEFKNPSESNDFQTPLTVASERETIAEQLQTEIERARWIETKTSYIGSPTNLPPGWDYTDDCHSKEEVKGRAKQQYQTLKQTWESVLGVNYDEYYATRLEQLNRTERNLDTHEIPSLELVPEAKGETYCQFCGQIDSEEALLHVPDKLDRMYRVCTSCAEHRTVFADDAVLQAKDEQARKNGGQRVFHDEYE